jgi:hypothetical protein
MVSLVDIVPQKRTVQISGGELELRGLGLRQIADLLLRFPALRNLLVQGAPELEVDALIIMAPDAIGAVIAEAAGQPEAAEAIADKLAIDDITECLLAVRDLTMPNGPAPFLDRLTRLINGGGVGLSGRVPGTSSPPMPNGSSPPDTIPAK